MSSSEVQATRAVTFMMLEHKYLAKGIRFCCPSNVTEVIGLESPSEENESFLLLFQIYHAILFCLNLTIIGR